MRNPLRRSLALAAALAAAVALAACSSSATTAKATTETFTSGKITSLKIIEANNPVIPLTYTGVVPATGTFALGGSGPKVGQYKGFITSKGTLMLRVASTTQAARFVDAKTCLAQDITIVHYTVVGSRSTGSFKDATGSGVVTAVFQANSELKGKCSLADNANPVTMKGSYILFTGTGPMKVPA